MSVKFIKCLDCDKKFSFVLTPDTIEPQFCRYCGSHRITVLPTEVLKKVKL